MIYYNIEDDLRECPDAMTYLIYGGRSTGKTYSTLKSAVTNKIPFIFIKRTQNDVELLCTGRKLDATGHRQGFHGEIEDGSQSADINFSPFASINRDTGWNITAYMINTKMSLGAFFHEDPSTGQPVGKPVGYIMALSAIQKYRGFEVTAQFATREIIDGKLVIKEPEEFWMIFDEFVPPRGTKKIACGPDCNEGSLLLDFYKTVERDRNIKGLKPIKLICLANPDSLASPFVVELDIVDHLARMQAKGFDKLFIEDRLIYIHKMISSEEYYEKESKAPIYIMMKDTDWAEKSLGNNFTAEDFSQVVPYMKLKGYQPIAAYKYKSHLVYIYRNDDKDCYRLTEVPPTGRYDAFKTYDLKRVSEQSEFKKDILRTIILYTIYDQITFEQYSMFDLTWNWRTYFEVY